MPTPSSELHGNPELVKKAIQLFTFLGRAQQMRERPIYDSSNFEECFWLSEIPSHAALEIFQPNDATTSDEPLLTLGRVSHARPPQPPTGILAWIDGNVDDSSSPPRLKSALLGRVADFADYMSLPESEADVDGASDLDARDEIATDTARDDNPRMLLLDDFEGVSADFDSWYPTWTEWAVSDAADASARKLYGHLFSAMERVANHSDVFELVVGLTCLTWTPESHQPVRRHLFTAPIRIEVDDDNGALTIVQDAPSELTLELDMLEPRIISNADKVDEIRTLAAEFGSHLFDREHIGALSRRLVHRLDADAEYEDEVEAPIRTSTARAAFAPAIILRRRSQRGIVEIYDRIVEHLKTTNEVPDGIIPLVDPNHSPAPSPDGSPGAVVSRGSEVYLPMPVNEKQLQVIKHVDAYAQTLVQGPPGTGKTHTAAALVSHLLAQGKRILITAQTDQALKEVRDKLPEQIRPLAVSVVGQSRSDMADLRVAVERISVNASEYDPQASARSMKALESEIDVLHRQRSSFYSELLRARELEVKPMRNGDTEGTLASIALQHGVAESRFGWIRDYGKFDSKAPAPLSNAEAVEWMNLNADQDPLANELEARQRLVALDELPTPDVFGALVYSEDEARAANARFLKVSDDAALEPVAALGDADQSDLQARMHDVATTAAELEGRKEEWLADALRDVRTGRSSAWNGRATEIARRLTDVSRLIAELGPTTTVSLVGNEKPVLRALALNLLAYLEAGGAVKVLPNGSPKVGAFANKAVKASDALFSNVQVNGLPPASVGDIQLFLRWLEAEAHLDALDRLWPSSIAIPVEDTFVERMQWHQTELEQLRKVLQLGEQLDDHTQWLRERDIPTPTWDDLAAVRRYSTIVDAVAASEAFTGATAPLADLMKSLRATQRSENASPVAGLLLEAASNRDSAQYAMHYRRLAHLHDVSLRLTHRDEASARLRSALPVFFEEVSSTTSFESWRERMAEFADAWKWATTGAWILEQDSTDSNVLQRKISLSDDAIQRKVEALAVERAWGKAVSSERLDGSSRAALTQYAQLVQRLGKGTGKYADARRREIRDAMDRCRYSVPVWIMPIYRISEQLRITPNMFDVVLVDEASQAGLDATFLQFLAPRIVVIGDDKQVSPSAVGVDQQTLRDLAQQHIGGDKYIASWQDPQRSLFDEAKMRFGGLITLTEHRRCVPEIIGFSNRIAYEPDGIRLIPVRQYGADRLDPVVPVKVPDGYESGRTNPSEADAIVEQIVNCIADKRYDGMTFGIISLLGSEQAKHIGGLLLDRIGPEEWFKRDLRSGDAPDFQGSERDVMFLSLVKAPAPGQRMGALTQDMYVQRFNVAASRAKDQLWVFHSVDLSELGNPEDMRFQLLDYCYGVVNRRANDDERVGKVAVSESLPVAPFDSLFEQRVFNRIYDRGFSVIPQYDVNGYRLDLVVVGGKARLAIECDGDHWHGPEAFERDLARQRDLERSGWNFFRIRESSFYADPQRALEKLWILLEDMGIRASNEQEPEQDSRTSDASVSSDQTSASYETDGTYGRNTSGQIAVDDRPTANPLAKFELPARSSGAIRPTAKAATPSDYEPSPASRPTIRVSLSPPAVQLVRDSVANDRHTDVTEVTHGIPLLEAAALDEGISVDRLEPFVAFSGNIVPIKDANPIEVLQGVLSIVAAEGPMLGSRIHTVYVRNSGGQRVGREIAHKLNSAITRAVNSKKLLVDNPLEEQGVKPKTFRLIEQDPDAVRERGPRDLSEVPPRELAMLLRVLSSSGAHDGNALKRAALEALGLKRLTPHTDAHLERIIEMHKRIDPLTTR